MRFCGLVLFMAFLFMGCSTDDFAGSWEPFEGRVDGVSQKGPFLVGSSVVLQELEGNSLDQTGKSFRGMVVNDNGDFSIENVSLESPYALLEVRGYFRNEVTGEKSNGMIFMKALADVSGNSRVNINLLTHLEYERVQTLFEKKKMSIAAAKRKADHEIFKAFFADLTNVNVEQLNIFGDSEADAVLLAANILLLGNESESGFMDNFVKLGMDLADNGVWNDSALMIKIADKACEVDVFGGLAKIRQNIESWGVAERVPAFEPYVKRFWSKVYGLGKCDASNIGAVKKNALLDYSKYWDSWFKCTENGWSAYPAEEDFYVDSRNGRAYRMVIMAGNTWMAANLDYAVGDSVVAVKNVRDSSVYKNRCLRQNAYAIGFGGVCYGECASFRDSCNVGWGYTWSEAQSICPEGWHLPTRAEAERLLNFVGGAAGATSVLGSEFGDCSVDVYGAHKSEDVYGFSLRGVEFDATKYCSAATEAHLWIADSSKKGPTRWSFDRRNAYFDSDDGNEFWPVRCVKNK